MALSRKKELPDWAVFCDGQGWGFLQVGSTMKSFPSAIGKLKKRTTIGRSLLTDALYRGCVAVLVFVFILIAESNSIVARCEADQSEDRLRELKSLPYLTETTVAEEDLHKLGVLKNEQGAEPGFTVLCTERSSTVRLIDMAGKDRHTIDLKGGARCKLFESYDDEHFLVLDQLTNERWGLLKIDWHGKVVWHIRDKSFHHDIDIADNGEIYTLVDQARNIEYLGEVFPVLDNIVVILDSDGAVKRQISLWDMLRPFIDRKNLVKMVEMKQAGVAFSDTRFRKAADLMHINSLEIVRKDSSVGPAGTVIICSRHLDLVAGIDLERKAVQWFWGPGELDRPHHPSLLNNENLLIFDNGSNRGWSRLIELDPSSKKIVWEYKSKKPLFFSVSRGSAQRLSNGNTLVAESDRGRVFEITRAGRVVWEYWGPESEGADGRFLRETIYRAKRLTKNSLNNPHYQELWQRVYGER